MSDTEIIRASVAITDVFVFIACVWGLVALSKQNAVRKNLYRYYIGLFTSVAMAAIAGAIQHQWFEEATGFWGTLPRFFVMISIGYAAFNLWLIAFELVASGAMLLRLQKLFRVVLYGYIGAVILFEQRFHLALGFYVPAVFFFLGATSYRYLKYKEKIHGWAVAGLAITIVAASIQAFQITLIPVYIPASSFYHLVQLPGIYLLYRHAKGCANWLPNH